jgi:hypothetical protein
LTLSPLADASQAIGNALVSQAVTIGGLIATASVLLTTILGVSRMSYAMAQNRDLPGLLGKINPKLGTPYPAIISKYIEGITSKNGIKHIWGSRESGGERLESIYRKSPQSECYFSPGHK